MIKIVGLQECLVIMLVERESLTQDVRKPTLPSIFSSGGYTPISFTCVSRVCINWGLCLLTSVASEHFLPVVSSHFLRAALTRVGMVVPVVPV